MHFPAKFACVLLCWTSLSLSAERVEQIKTPTHGNSKGGRDSQRQKISSAEVPLGNSEPWRTDWHLRRAVRGLNKQFRQSGTLAKTHSRLLQSSRASDSLKVHKMNKLFDLLNKMHWRGRAFNGNIKIHIRLQNCRPNLLFCNVMLKRFP